METSTGFKPRVIVTPDSEALADKSLSIFISQAVRAINKTGVFRVAISGGNTPKRFFQLLDEQPKAKQLPWERIHIFWVDERIVKPDSKWSNYKLAADTFIGRVALPQANVHRIPTEHDDFNEAVRRYEQNIRSVFGIKENEIPKFDLIVLGMGKDGHTGSLFPNSYAPLDTEHLACVVYVLEEGLNRITMTHPVLCAASHLIVMVSGKEKAEIFKTILTSEPDEVRYPIHYLWPSLDKITWLADKEAAELL